MENLLEIRDGCTTSEQFLKSLSFSRYLAIYKQEFIDDLDHRSEHRPEARHKVDFIKEICARHFLEILDSDGFDSHHDLEQAKHHVRFIDGAFHHFRRKSYSRLIRLQNEVVSTGAETPETVKDKVTGKAMSLTELIIDTRRMLMKKVGLEHGVRRSQGLDVTPNVTAGEISGHYFRLPSDYVPLSHVPVTIAADIRTGVDYSTPSNKRALPFYELDHNPLHLQAFDPDDWVSVPLQVGAYLIIAYIHKSRGCIEMEPGLLNLFPFARVADIRNSRAADGIFIFGDPAADLGDLGYYWDDKNQVLVGVVPNRDELKYFGYAKKPVLTLHNVLAIRNGEIPLHCGCTRYIVKFDEQSDEPYITEMLIKADDMGRIHLQKGDDHVMRPFFYGTETGAFACLDGFSDEAKMQMEGREIGYNKDTGSNARQIVPVTDCEEVTNGDPLDVLLYMNNFTLVEPGESTIDTNMSVEDAIDHLRLGERVAAGSTHTGRGSKESSYWANPFPLLKEADGSILHTELFEQFVKNEKEFINVVRKLVEQDEMQIGVAYSQLMAGVYKDNSDEDILRCGYKDRDDVEMNAPVHLAEGLIELIKKTALRKRDSSADRDEVSITIALVGDSRTGKSETAEKMEGTLNLSLI